MTTVILHSQSSFRTQMLVYRGDPKGLGLREQGGHTAGRPPHQLAARTGPRLGPQAAGAVGSRLAGGVGEAPPRGLLGARPPARCQAGLLLGSVSAGHWRRGQQQAFCQREPGDEWLADHGARSAPRERTPRPEAFCVPLPGTSHAGGQPEPRSPGRARRQGSRSISVQEWPSASDRVRVDTHRAPRRGAPPAPPDGGRCRGMTGPPRDLFLPSLPRLGS